MPRRRSRWQRRRRSPRALGQPVLRRHPPADAGLPPDYALLGRVTEGRGRSRRSRGWRLEAHRSAGGDREHHLAERLMAKLAVGHPAPFELPGTGDAPTSSRITTRPGVILAFYPGDFTPVCTQQFCSYRDDGDRIEGSGCRCWASRPRRSSRTSGSREERPRRSAAPDPASGAGARLRGGRPGGFSCGVGSSWSGGECPLYRHVALFGLRYQDVGDLERAVAGV